MTASLRANIFTFLPLCVEKTILGHILYPKLSETLFPYTMSDENWSVWCCTSPLYGWPANCSQRAASRCSYHMHAFGFFRQDTVPTQLSHGPSASSQRQNRTKEYYHGRYQRRKAQEAVSHSRDHSWQTRSFGFCNWKECRYCLKSIFIDLYPSPELPLCWLQLQSSP